MIDWITGIVVLLAVIAAGVPIAFAMTAVALVGIIAEIGMSPALSMLGQVFYDNGMSYTLSVMPLFVLMGNFVLEAGLADDMYAAANAWLRHYRGGLAMATIVACGGFSSVCGSSLATAATMARVSMPSMHRYGYTEALATGSIAAGGTLGILIPPSIVLVLYGVITQQDIGKLFLAGIIPGLVGVLGYLIAVRLSLLLRPDQARHADPLPLIERIKATRGVAGILALFSCVMGGIYLGIFTATEAAGIGAFGAFLIALVRRRLSLRTLYEVLVETGRMTAMLFFILFGALLFSNFVNLAGMPGDLRSWITALGAHPTAVLLVILMIYLLLGAVLESISMMLLTVPVFFPVIVSLGVDPIWFGIFVVVAIEISLITPPVGLNVFVLKSIVPEVPTGTIFRGVVPFIAMDIVRIMLLIALPWMALVLPATM
ncbi:tripartite ATP-independent transporter DctM subunit [Tepidamorphus gemmatus]|uniref:TRAP transporter large permease protein n=1 Tax=Tepidamorphus gemmatus TaxID=747076 RepID=A0A4R3MDS6_9HYPH|nr:TRAP transporter large permease [Tepidamorphus gemmatus]TCT11924.1 tripartite ATP-independent transporter DctM subunit [Tepidamorphus gemmatus]